MPRPKRWKPLEFTAADIKDNMARFGTIPPDVIELFANRKKDAKKCLAACKRILEKEPNNSAVLLYMGIIFHEQGKRVTALRYLDRVTELTPLVYPAWRQKGMCQLELRRLRAARFSFGRLMEFTHGSSEAPSFIALTFYLGGKKEIALAFLDQVLETGNIEDPHVLLHLRAKMEEHMGNKNDALIHYIESAMLNKSEEKVTTALKIHELAAEKAEEKDEDDV
jgi:tetratricopeptide (TPR) repeat protein